MKIELDVFLHPRILKKCISLYESGFFPDAAFNAIKQVELAFKEKAGVEDEEKLFGARLYEKILGSGKSIKLKVPLGDNLQKEAKEVFKSVSSYYRNYLAHKEGNKVDKIICTRILIIASELLDLINASSISFTEIGGAEGLIKQGIFENKLQLSNLLSFLSSQVFPYESFDGMFEDLIRKDYTKTQYEAVFDLGLIEYHSEIKDHSHPGESEDWDDFGWIELTPQGRNILTQFQNSSKSQ
ncbi:MAG: TIGR02391 family protein [Candidatus Heimdallarchaeaceae archaeon]